MSHTAALQTANAKPRPAAGQGILLQRKCACGGAAGLSGACEECGKKKISGIQAKLKVNEPGDIYEQEADRVADQVLAAPANRAVGAVPPYIQRYAGPATRGADPAPASVDRVLAGAGRPLDPALQQHMEQRFGHDFSRVRVHSGAAAEQSAREVNARAYTVGHDIVFGAGRFAPGTLEGRRLLAHELTHVVQQSVSDGIRVGQGDVYARQGTVRQGALSGIAHTIQREVEPVSIRSADTVLGTIDTLNNSYAAGGGKSGDKAADEVARRGAAVAGQAVANNLARLIALSKKFNPGAPGKAGPTNAFVYTCRCGWIDLGHFFISAAGAFASGYARQLEVRVEGKPITQGDLLKQGFDRLAPLLEPLLDTVAPGGRGKQILAQQRKLFESGEPRDISLGFGGYLTEFYQQAFKLYADRLQSVPDSLKGEQRSAFTAEDLPSDCYGAALGQDVWERARRAADGVDVAPIHALMVRFFQDCRAVYPQPGTRARCEMMDETSPGSCAIKDGRPVPSQGGGTPRQHITEVPLLLASAKPLCGESFDPLRCRSGRGPAVPDPKAVLDVSPRRKSVTLVLPEGVPGLRLSGPTFVRVNARGDVFAYSTLRDLGGLGDTRTALHVNLRSGRFDVRAEGRLTIHARGRITVDFGRLLKGAVGPELKQLEALVRSEEFSALVQATLTGGLDADTFVGRVRALLKQSFPAGLGGSAEAVLARLTDREALALATSLEAQGSVRLGDIPVSGLLLHKSGGRNPLLGLEAGLVTSDLQSRKRLVVGAKGWLYGEDVLQAHLTAGVDLGARAAIVGLHVENKTLLGNKLSFDLDLQHRLEGADVVSAKLRYDF